MNEFITQKNQTYAKEEKEIEMPDQPVPPRVPNPSAKQKSQPKKDEECSVCAQGPDDDSAAQTQTTLQEETDLEDDVYPEPKPRAKGDNVIKSKPPRAKRRH